MAIDLPTEDVFSIPSFQKLASIAEMFDTSQRENPYTQAVWSAFLNALTELDRALRELRWMRYSHHLSSHAHRTARSRSTG